MGVVSEGGREGEEGRWGSSTGCAVTVGLQLFINSEAVPPNLGPMSTVVLMFFGAECFFLENELGQVGFIIWRWKSDFILSCLSFFNIYNYLASPLHLCFRCVCVVLLPGSAEITVYLQGLALLEKTAAPEVSLYGTVHPWDLFSS